MADFPAYVKIKLRGFGEQPEDIIARTEMEGGIAKQTRTKAVASVQRTISGLIESKANYLAWEAWRTAENEANHGAAWFNWTDPVDGQVKLARIVKGSYSARPRISTLEAWDLQFTLETIG